MTLQRNIWIGFIAALAIIAWLAIISFQNSRASRQSMQWVAHTNSVLFHSEQILSSIIDLEAGQRGYSLTGVEAFLDPTYAAIKNVEAHKESLARITSHSTNQQKRSETLEQLVTEKLAFTERAINARRIEGLDAARQLNATMQGKELTDKIRQLIGELQEEEKKLLDERTKIAQSRSERFNKYFMAMLVITGLIVILLFYAVYFNIVGREKAQKSLRAASRRIEDIYNNAPCGYHSVNDAGVLIEINKTFLEWLQYDRSEVIGKLRFADLLVASGREKYDRSFAAFKQHGHVRDEEFEVRRKDGSSFFILVNASAVYDAKRHFVQSRSTVLDYTEQHYAHQRIEQLNKELESFSYSVSHDLRAPLRSIHGYTQILTEDYARMLDDEGRRLLQVVVNNSQRMARLIDDLLDFSRISRKDMSLSRVNTHALVTGIVTELQSLEPERNISVAVKPLEACDADANLLRQVWYNLISNAFKYSRKQEKAVVEISSETGPGEIIYCVRDNGTGFDMQYADKLFGVFQRLHRQNEFEGTGVGLAIVHRIITRHGGSVWAQAEIDKGAAFYFSLPRNPLK